MQEQGNSAAVFPGRVGVQQRVLPAYRAEFFDALADACARGLSVFAGSPLAQEGILPAKGLSRAIFHAARNRQIGHPHSALYLCWQSGLLAWLRSWQPDVLVVEANARYLSTPAAVRWMHQRGAPVLGWGLGAPSETGALSGVRQHWRRRFLLSLDGIIAYSQKGAQEYMRIGFPPEKVFIAPNAVAPRPRRDPPERPASFSAGRPLVLFVGRLQHRKRVDNLLRACAHLEASLRPRLLIVGDGPAREALEDMAQQLYPQAEFVGARFGADLEQLFDAADLFVLPGTGGLAVQQAMAHALPVIVAQGDGTQGDLVRNDNGWLIPNDDWLALRQALTEALSDAARLRRMGAVSYRIVSQEINLEKMVEAFVLAFQRVLD